MLEMTPSRDRTTILEAQSYSTFLEIAASLESMRVEYMDGDIVMTPAPNIKHQRIVRKLLVLLDELSRTQVLGEAFIAPVDVELESGVTIVQPDLIFIRQARLNTIVDPGKIIGAPDLLVEILSPSTARIDRAVKLQLYARYGVPEYWIVNPEDNTVEVYTHHEQTYLVAGIYGPGETIAAGLFAPAKINVDSIIPAGDQTGETGGLPDKQPGSNPDGPAPSAS